VSIADSSNCGPITLDAGNPGLTYAWSNGPTTQTMTATTSGIYTVTVSDGNCAASDSANVTIESIPTVSLPPDSLLCNGASMTLDAGNQAGAAILWSTGDTSQTISANTAGTYWVNVSTAAGCQGSDSITVSTLLAPVGSITSNLGGCPTIAFTGSNAGGGAANGTWDFGDGGTASGVNPSHTYTANGSYTVTYSQSNACGADVATTTITVNCITGVSNPSQVDIALFPNPTAGAVSMELNLPSAIEGIVTVMDLHGRMVIQKAASLVAGRNRVDLDLGKMSAGVYLVRLSADGLHWQGKVVKE
jgi:PKD repeat protein